MDMETGRLAAATSDRLLAADEPAPVTVERSAGLSAFFLACDHAGDRIPKRLRSLGLDDRDLGRHIAIDIGAAAVARRLSAQLDATLALQTYSRLVIDCNRAFDAQGSIATISETTDIPGNRALDPGQAEARRREIFTPYHDTIRGLLDQRAAAGQTSVLVAVHSFTPVFKGVSRPWHIGLLYNRDRRLADIMFDLLGRDDGLCVGDNQPYAVGDATDYTIPVHGERRGIAHIEIEIRQDLVTEPEGQAEWAARLAKVLTAALPRLEA